MLHITNLNEAPPGGWRYTQPESGFAMSGITFGQLLKRVAAHRHSNGFPTDGSLSAEVQDSICEHLGFADQCRRCSGGLVPPAQRSIRWSDVGRFMKVMAAWVTASGDKFVPAEEANRRAALCASCPYNKPVRGCSSCHAILEEISEAVAGRTTPSDTELFGCGICGCANKVQVHAPLEALRAGITPEMEFPPQCWKTAAQK